MQSTALIKFAVIVVLRYFGLSSKTCSSLIFNKCIAEEFETVLLKVILVLQQLVDKV